MKPWNNYSLEAIKREEFPSLLFDPTLAVIDEYFRLIPRYHYSQEEINKNSKFPVTYTAMHGVGAPFTLRALQSFHLPSYIPVLSQLSADPEFPTVKFPNPEEGKGALALSIETANTQNSHLILANDPDADRLAIAERARNPHEQWNILNGNEIALLFADYVWKAWRKNNPQADPNKCVMISSTVSSKALKAMAAKEGFLFLGTLTGFKWMGNVADEFIKKGFTFLFAYEVEIGFLTGDISLDKDGIRMAALFNELALSLYNSPSSHPLPENDQRGLTCVEHLETLYKRYGYFFMSTSYFFCSEVRIFEEIFQRLRHFDQHGVSEQDFVRVGENAYPKRAGQFVITSVRDISAGIDTSKPGNKSVLPVMTDSFMITFRFANGGTATLRNSGTEPKLKYYIESSSMESKAIAEQTTMAMRQAIIEQFIQPLKFMLKHQGEK
jgi:phosphomannomutase